MTIPSVVVGEMADDNVISSVHPQITDPQPADFTFELGESLDDLGGPALRYRSNVTATHLLKQLEHEGRPATFDEQRLLARYTGWGDSRVLKLAQENDDLLDKLTEEEWQSIKASSLNAHFTAIPVVRAIWRALEHLGIGRPNRIRCLEPAAGIRHFYSAMPLELRESSRRVAVELDGLSARIQQYLHPHYDACGTRCRSHRRRSDRPPCQSDRRECDGDA